MRITGRTLTALMLGAMFAAGALADDADWYDGPWKYRKNITIAATNVSETVTNFPVLLSVTDSDLMKAKSDGGDLLITASDGTTKLDRELEKFDDGTGEVVLWFRAETLSSVSDNEFFVYYGNANASESNDTAVWSTEYRMVQHMGDDPSGTVYDSTSRDSDLTSQGAMTNSNVVTGKIGDALEFDGSNDALYRGDDSDLDFGSGSFTISAWGYHDDSARDLILRKRDSPYNAYDGYFLGCHGNDFMIEINDYYSALPHEERAQQSGYYPGGWYHFVGVVDRGTTNGSIRLYVNADLKNEDTDISAAPNVDNGYGLYIGKVFNAGAAYGDYWDGKLDEIRLIGAARSTGWIETEYANQNNPSGFVTVSSEETMPGMFIMVR